MHGQPKASHAIAVLFVATLGVIPPAAAQYMYLDSDGDGSHTNADVVNPHGMTRIGIWVVTNRNRDGSPVPCETDGTIAVPDIRAVLVVRNGTVEWGTFDPDEQDWSDYRPECPDSSRFVLWFALPSPLYPGRHFLGTISVLTRSGTPSITLGSGCPGMREQFTGFSSKCGDGQEYDEHLLGNGEGGFQVDGLPYGGAANTPPILTAPNSFLARAGSKTSFRITAYDSDDDPVTFRLGSAIGRLDSPPFVTVRTLDQGHGHATGEIVLSPDSCAEGTWLFALEASDGTWSDHLDVGARVERVARPIPPNPMGPPRVRPKPPGVRHVDSRDLSPSKAALIGDWEWTELPRSRPPMNLSLFDSRSGPITVGTRRRLVLGGYGEYEIYRIAADNVSQVESGKYSLGNDRGGRFLLLAPLGASERKYAIWKSASDSLCLYPWGASDAAVDHYVSVPYWVHHGNRLDTLAVLEPLGPPQIHPNGSLTLRASLREAMRRFDSGFRPYSFRDWTAPGNIVYGDGFTPWAVVGDFDGDLIQDIALYGQSGKDEVVLAVLSGHTNTRVVEVARRPATSKWPHPYLELVPRGTEYDPCWARRGIPKTDAIGIISPGVARFDYALANGNFVLYAPVP